MDHLTKKIFWKQYTEIYQRTQAWTEKIKGQRDPKIDELYNKTRIKYWGIDENAEYMESLLSS